MVPKFQAVTMKEIKERAHAPPAEITRLGAKPGSVLSSRSAANRRWQNRLNSGNATKMLKFEEQDHALNELSQQLARLSHGAWTMEDVLRLKRINLTKRTYGQ